MAYQITNKKLNQLLADLGFERGDVTEKHHRVWQHPDSGCLLLLPDNKMLKPPRQADLTGVRTQLDQQGHLDAATFDAFVATGRLPASTVGDE